MNPARRKTIGLLQWLLYAFAFCLPISISLAEPLAFLVLLVWLVDLLSFRHEPGIRSCPLFLPIVAFAIAALVSSLIGPRPAACLAKGHRLLLLAPVFAIPRVSSTEIIDKYSFPRCLVVMFIAGTVCLAVYDIIRVPVSLYLSSGGDSSAGIFNSAAWFDLGNMRDPQFYMVALCFLCAAFVMQRGNRHTVLATLLTAVALVLHFKRGAWLSFLLATVFLTALGRRWKLLITIILCAGALLFIPQVRERMASLSEESEEAQGGRFVLWTEVAPALLQEYPGGIGWCGTRHEDFTPYANYIQPKLNHLHNNILQVAVETGWVGLTVWIIWMGMTFFILLRAYFRSRKANRNDAWLALGACAGFLALLANGMVESNFRDSEILMLFGFLMGLGCYLLMASQAEQPNSATH